MTRAAQTTVHSTRRRMRIACWITKATNTHSGYAIFIAFPQQKWLHERASMLRHTYIASLVPFSYPDFSLTLSVVFPCFFLSCKANARGKTRKDGARPALFHIICYLGCSVVICVVVCIVCVYCHRVTTQLQLINIL
jgi:hypothetical protein